MAENTSVLNDSLSECKKVCDDEKGKVESCQNDKVENCEYQAYNNLDSCVENNNKKIAECNAEKAQGFNACNGPKLECNDCFFKKILEEINKLEALKYKLDNKKPGTDNKIWVDEVYAAPINKILNDSLNAQIIPIVKIFRKSSRIRFRFLYTSY